MISFKYGPNSVTTQSNLQSIGDLGMHANMKSTSLKEYTDVFKEGSIL